MTWERWYRLRHQLRASLALYPSLALVAALACAPAVRWLDHATGWAGFGFTPDGARGVLGALAGSMLTFLVFVLSAMLIVVQLATGQLTPRILGFVFTKPRIKLALSFLTFTYVYTLAALGRVEADVPQLLVGLAVGCNL